MSVAIGIDLGTTNTAVAAVVDGVAVTLEDEAGRRLIPSVVSFHPSGNVLVGEAAKERLAMDPENTIYSVKPLIGRTFDSEEVASAAKRFPFKLVEGAKKSVMVRARGTDYALPEISAFVLRRAKAIAEAQLGQTVDKAVITVPANFNDLQRASTKIAGKLAGLEVMRILNEPTAAALAYGQSIAKAEKIAIYDLGGGTFDVTLLDLTGNVFEVLATAGDMSLGGDDVDRIIADRIALDILKRLNVDAKANPAVYSKLKHVAESIKKELSSKTQISQQIEDLGWGVGGKALTMPFLLARPEFERLVQPLIERTIVVARQSIEAVGLTPRSFDRVILVGGSTRMPIVARMVQDLFGQPPSLKVNPDEVVALGAAIQANSLNRTKAKGKVVPVPQLQASAPAASPAPAAKPAPAVRRLTPGAPGSPGAPRPAPPKAPPPVPGKAPPPPSSQQPSTVPGAFTITKSHAVITFSPPPPTASELASSPTEFNFGIPTPRAFPAPELPVPPPPAPPPPEPPASDDFSSFDLDLGPRVEAPAPPAAASSPLDFGELASSDGFFADEGAIAPALAIEDEAFARGSAIATNQSSPLLIDVTPLSLRIETVGGYSDVLIDANSPVPCEKSRAFRTASDNQSQVIIRVAQGESTKFAENTFLGELELSGLRAARRGELTIQVTFELDADGILGVRAMDKETGKQAGAKMRLLGTASDDADMAQMAARQAQHAVS